MSIAEKTRNKKQRGTPIKVRTKYGYSTVGRVAGSVYEKQLHNSGILRSPEAIALSPSEIRDAQAAGAHTFRAVLVDQDRTVSIEFERFKYYSFPVDRGFGGQLGVCLDRFAMIGQTAPRNPVTDNPRGFGAGEFVRPQPQQLEFFHRG